MSKKLMSLVMVVGILFMASCDKEETGINDGPTSMDVHKVKVVTSGFNESIGPMTLNTNNSIDNYVTRLRYFVYNEAGIIVGMPRMQNKRIVDSPMLPPDNFGTLDLELPNGKYTLVVLGEAKNEDEEYGDFENNLAYNIRTLRLLNLRNPRNVGDLFLKIEPLVVENSSIDVPVRLERVVGQLAVNINENIPAEASRMEIILGEDVLFYNFGEDRVEYMNNSSRTYVYDITEQRGTFFSKKLHILNTFAPFSVTVVCKDTAGEVIATRTVHNLNVARNTRVTLASDNFFAANPVGPAEGTFAVSINSSWGTAPIENEF